MSHEYLFSALVVSIVGNIFWFLMWAVADDGQKRYKRWYEVLQRYVNNPEGER